MTLSEIQAILAEVDPDIKHYFSMSTAEKYSYWEEYGQLPITADGTHAGGWSFGVHLFTKTENDTLADAFFIALDACDDIAIKWTTTMEPDTGYIHHLFDCEAI